MFYQYHLKSVENGLGLNLFSTIFFIYPLGSFLLQDQLENASFEYVNDVKLSCDCLLIKIYLNDCEKA